MYGNNETKAEQLQREIGLYSYFCKLAISRLSDKRYADKLDRKFSEYQRSTKDDKKASKLRSDIRGLKSKKENSHFTIDDLVRAASKERQADVKKANRNFCSNLRGVEGEKLVRELLNKYYESVARLHSEQQKERDKAARDEQRRKELEQRELERQQERIKSMERLDTDTYTQKPVVKHSEERRLAGTKDELVRDFEEYVSKLGANPSYDDLRLVDSYAKEFSVYHSSHSIYSKSSLRDGVELRCLFKSNNDDKHKSRISELDEMAVLISNLLPKELLKEDVNYDTKRLFDTLKLQNSLVEYERIYNKYQQQMSRSDEKQLRAYFQRTTSDIDRLKKMGFNVGENTLVTPAMIKDVVNKRVSNVMIENSKDYSKPDSRYQVVSATKYMDIKEINELYRKMSYHNKESMIPSFETTQERDNYIRERDGSLQRNVAEAIVSKINTNKELSAAEREALIVRVVREYMHEEAKFDLSSDEAKREAERERTNEDTLAITEKKQKLKEKYFGMGKLKKVLAKITGEWAKMEQIMAIDEMMVDQEKDIDDFISTYNR